MHDRCQPRGEYVLDRAAAAADLHERLATDQPHRAQITRMEKQARQAAIDHHARHGHQRPPCRIPEHDIAVFNGAPPLPLCGTACHPAVNA